MIYRFMELDPLLLIFVICPLLSILLGGVLSWLDLDKKIAPITAFLFPLLYITSDWAAFKANLGAWILYGALYSLIAYVAGWVMSLIKGKRHHKH